MSSGTAIFTSTRHRAPNTIQCHGSLMGQFLLHVTVGMVRTPLGVERDSLVEQLVLTPAAEREGHHEENENQADDPAQGKNEAGERFVLEERFVCCTRLGGGGGARTGR